VPPKGAPNVLLIMTDDQGYGVSARTLRMPKTVPFILPPCETFDVGIDLRSGVNDLDYQSPFRFNGKINKVTFNLGPSQLTEVDQKKANEAAAKAKD
jgi:hypothetical protein